MNRCPSCGEELADVSLAFCDQCGAHVGPSGLLMLGASLGELLGEPSPAVVEPPPEQRPPAAQRFVPFASWRALRLPQ